MKEYYEGDLVKVLLSLHHALAWKMKREEKAALVLQKAIEFYRADFCGIFYAKEGATIWKPLWWFSAKKGFMGEVTFDMHRGIKIISRWQQLGIKEALYLDITKECLLSREDMELLSENKVQKLLVYSLTEEGSLIFLVRNAERYCNNHEFLAILSRMLDKGEWSGDCLGSLILSE